MADDLDQRRKAKQGVMGTCTWVHIETGDQAESVPMRFTAACTPRTRIVPRGTDMTACSYCGKPTQVVWGAASTEDRAS